MKQWTVTLWTAAIGTALATPRLSEYVAITGLIPLFFLLVEAAYRRIQRRFIWRSERIGEFISDGRLEQALQSSHAIEFRLWDPSGVYTGDSDYREFISFRRVIRFSSIGIFYLGLAFASLLIAVIHTKS